MKHMFLTCLLLLSGTMLMAQERIVKGRVTSALNNEGLPGVNVLLKDTNTGVVTNTNGYYEIAVPGPEAVLVFSFVGFLSEEVKVANRQSLDIRLMEDLEQMSEVVISGTRRAEKITETPATIEVIGKRELENIGTFNPGELLARVKGVDFVRAGVVGTGINVRGFNSNFNAKNLQVTDGRFSTLIATGLPMGPLNTVIKEDIERMEIVLGPNAALFGPNAHNGLLNTITKDPRGSAGTIVSLGAGNQSMFTARARHAQVLSDKFAFKVTGEYTRAEEFDYVDSVYLGAVVPKRGVVEYRLDNDIKFLRGETGLYFTPVSGTDIIVQAGASNSTYLSPTNVGRNQIRDWNIYYAQAKLVHNNWFAQLYHTWSSTDSTYSIDDRTKAYHAIKAANPEMSEAELARQSFSTGALFRDKSRRWNAELQYNNHIAKKFYYTFGAQWQRDMANSMGTYLLDKNEDDYITLNQIGAYGQFDYNFGQGLKATAAFRGDHHEIYGFNFLPKFGLVKSGEWGGVRLTYGQGIAAPTILNMYGDLFSGLILGNAEGFTMADGTKIEKQKVEKMQTFELGYRGQPMGNRFSIDANAYYNISENFLSPATLLGVATQRGNQPMSEVQSGYAAYNGLVISYVNFGKFNTYGADLGLSYMLTDALSAFVNYSYFGYSIDEQDLANDFNKDGKVTQTDLLVNSPNHKMAGGLTYAGSKVFGSIFGRWVEKYNYFSSYQIASETIPGATWGGMPIVEDALSGNAWNYGPLGGFVTFDVSAGYKFSPMFRLSAQVTNLFDTEMREFTAAPPTGRLFSLELRVDLPAIK
ncbi:TonB-dependent receptor [Cesiribacter andamanensis]|uniref:Colicin I receptor n=1 Tax=Cesiribacter andamanensis AMV16 TaxID=1279009 RepID=M7NK05_9BACT|nr:TonB-dependent receptor [Cesiribacter andamanensis]EMR02115.1 Colicin I receptor precursor [Cesiribacter andamanensis AMV16]